VLAEILNGCWRVSPLQLRITPEELEQASNSLWVSGASSLGWWRIHGSDLESAAIAPELRRHYHEQAIKAMIQEDELARVVSQLRGGGVEPLLVKGWAVARLYPQPGLRPFGDIDLCVRPEQRRTTEDLLSQPDLAPFEVDLIHEEFDRLDAAGWDALFAHAEPADLGTTRVRVLGPEDHLAFLCMHLLRHGAWRPLWLVDVAAALESRPADFDWQRCLGRNRRRADWIACAIGLANQLVGANVDGTPVTERARRLPGWMLPSVLKRWDVPGLWSGGSATLPLASYITRPSEIPWILWNRWPDPILATVALNGPFNRAPRLPFQVANVSLRTLQFLAHLPRHLRFASRDAT
jgi:hypothetical protein